jgi:hypothetical protein
MIFYDSETVLVIEDTGMIRNQPVRLLQTPVVRVEADSMESGAFAGEVLAEVVWYEGGDLNNMEQCNRAVQGQHYGPTLVGLKVAVEIGRTLTTVRATQMLTA